MIPSRLPARDNSAFIRILSFSFFALMILVALGPMTSQMGDGGGDGDGNMVRQGAYLFVALLTLFGAQPWRSPRVVLCIPYPIMLSLLICLMTIAWSAVPGIALRRLILTSMIAWTACMAVDQLGFRRTINILRIILVLLLIANFVAVLAFPNFGIHQFSTKDDPSLTGDWRGIMMQKNHAGAVTAITILLFIFDARHVGWLVRIGVIAASALFLLFTESKTSVGMLIGVIGLGYLFGMVHFKWRIALLPAVTITLVMSMIYFNIYRYAFVQAVNDPVTFTGRVVIWNHLLAYLSDNFWVGTGYGSFWNVGPSSPIYQYSSDWVQAIATGHNGYLDLACALGIPLAGAVIACMILLPFLRLLVSWQTVGDRGAMLIALLVFCAGHNMTESSLLDRDVFVQVMLTLTTALIWKLSSTAYIEPVRQVPAYSSAQS